MLSLSHIIIEHNFDTKLTKMDKNLIPIHMDGGR